MDELRRLMTVAYSESSPGPFIEVVAELTETIRSLDEVRAKKHNLELAVIVHATAIRDVIERLFPNDPVPPPE